MTKRTPDAGNPVLQALIDSIEMTDGDVSWDYAAMYAVRDALNAPIDMVLYCPDCGMQHIDAADRCPECPGGSCMCVRQAERWTNPPHRSHLCHGCGYVWRPADVPTNGVAVVKTKGKNDSPIRKPICPGVLVDHFMKTEAKK